MMTLSPRKNGIHISIFAFLYLSFSPMALSATNSPESAQADLRGTIPVYLSINQAMNEALLRSPRAESARMQLGIAKAGIARATEMPNPSLFMDNGYKAEFTYRYGVTIPIEPPWKLALRLILAKKQIRLADYQIAKALWALRGDTRKSYIEVLIAQERAETIGNLAELYKQLVETTQMRFKAGDVAELDVNRAELGYQRALINLEVERNKIKQAKQGLSVLLGRQYDSSVDIPRLPQFKLYAEKVNYLPDFDSKLPDLQTLLAKAEHDRLEMKIVEQTIINYGVNLKLAYANILQNPSIGAGSSVVNGPALGPDASFDSKNNFHGFFLQATVPLPILNFQQGDITQYRATIAQLKSEVRAQKNIIEREVVEAYTAVLTQRQKIISFEEKTLERSRRIAEMSRRSYEIGQSDIASVLIAQQENMAIRNEYLDAIYAYELAYTELEQSVGSTFY